MKYGAPRSDDRGHGELALRLRGGNLREERADLKVAGIDADGAVAPGTASLQ